MSDSVVFFYFSRKLNVVETSGYASITLYLRDVLLYLPMCDHRCFFWSSLAWCLLLELYCATSLHNNFLFLMNPCPRHQVQKSRFQASAFIHISWPIASSSGNSDWLRTWWLGHYYLGYLICVAYALSWPGPGSFLQWRQRTIEGEKCSLKTMLDSGATSLCHALLTNTG